MAYIKVDHSKFEAAASAVDKYVTLMKNKMTSAQNEVATLSSSWQGLDYTQFKREFDKVDNNDSTHAQMVKSDKYKNAQSRAVNRANSLPKW